MSDLIGQQLENYHIEALIGEGGMGDVYRARDIRLNRLVAFKVMDPRLARQPEFQQRFQQEAQAAARLKHASIVQIYHFGDALGLLYMAMTYVPGPTLGEYLRRMYESSQVILLSESMSLVAQIAAALGYAHRNGVVHRDVKPDNVLLESSDAPEQEGDPPIRAVVTDFGLAKLLEGGVDTQTGAFLGTMPYMSPEQLRGRQIDGRSDIYSLGIMLYQLVTGRLPFENIRTPADAVEKHIREQPPLPRDVRPGIPQEVEEIVLKSIAKKPEDRYQTGEEMAKALRGQASSIPDDVQIAIAATVPVVSLMTQIMPDMKEVPPPSIGPSLVAPSVGDYLIIQRQGEANQTFSLSKTTNNIGRTEGNDLILKDASVSRRHARLERSTRGWQLVDLGSSNGTWVKGRKLLPNIPESWEKGQVARIGPYMIRWQPSAKTGVGAVAPTAFTAMPSVVGATQILTMDGQLGVLVNPTNIDVQPGSVAEVQVELFNQGTLVDHFRLEIEGIPAAWVTLPKEPVQLMTLANVSLPFSIHPPKESSTRAGRHRYQLVIFSEASSRAVANISGNINVAPFTQFAVDAQPTHLTNKGTCRVSITNQGNAQTSFTIAAQDDADAINFRGVRSGLMVAPGKSEVTSLELQAKQQPLTGAKQPFPYQIKVTAADGVAKIKPGVLDIRPRYPTWLIALIPIIAILCCLSTVAGGQWWYANIRVPGSQTATAEVLQLAALEGTSTALQAAETIQAQQTDEAQIFIGGTATKNASDIDADGLSHAQELQMKTNPDDPDSDDDGLLDGDEQIWGTNPLVADSDGDTLPDGQEVHEIGSSPINPNTDGDDLPDNVDPDPGQVPTPTPIPTDTPPPTPTDPPPPTNVPTLPPTPTSTDIPTQIPTNTAIPTLISTNTATSTQIPTSTATSTVTTPTITPSPTPFFPVANPDCLPYIPENLTIVDEGSSGWLLTDGGSRMKVLDNQSDAEKALAVARRHTYHCFIGRGNARADRRQYIAEYWTGDSGIQTIISGEDCINYNENNLSTVDLGATGWRLTDGVSAMLILDNSSDADHARLLAQAFSEQCFIGRSNSRSDRSLYIMRYWK